MVENKCMQKAATDESKAFFFKMIGDYYRYVSECATSDNLDNVKS